MMQWLYGSRKKMAEKISIIREKLQAAAVTELPVLISAYGADERAGVRAEIARAEKRILSYEKEKTRTEALKRYEKEYAAYAHICGIDEVGRGPLAGPVVAGAVILPKDCDILYINDSKKLSEKKREELYDVIMEKAVAVGLGYSTPERIDEINILQATYEAMREAIGKLPVTPGFIERRSNHTAGLHTSGSYHQRGRKEYLHRRCKHCCEGDEGPADG